jgi:hypothetical protein
MRVCLSVWGPEERRIPCVRLLFKGQYTTKSVLFSMKYATNLVAYRIVVRRRGFQTG